MSTSGIHSPEHHTPSHDFDCAASLFSGTGSAPGDGPDKPRTRTAGPSLESLRGHQPFQPADFSCLRRNRRIGGYASMAARGLPQRLPERVPTAMSVIDIAATDLHQLKKSFIAHARAFSCAEHAEIKQMALNASREIRLMEKDQLRRQQQLSRKDSFGRGRTSLQTCGDLVSGIESSMTSIFEGSVSNVDVGNTVEPASQRTRMLSVWIYDLAVQERLSELALLKKGERHPLPRSGSLFGMFPGGTKAAVSALRSPPVPSRASGFDMRDDMYERLRALDTSEMFTQADIEPETLTLPLPVFVYVFSRALFRYFHMSRFPSDTFTARERPPTASPKSQSFNQTPSESGVNILSYRRSQYKHTVISRHPYFGPPPSADEDRIVHEVDSLMDGCRRAVLSFFDLLDTEQIGTISWSAFTDALMEQIEVQHRGMKDKENYEEVAHTDARVFDKYVVEPFPSILMRLGYVGAVTELRCSGSAVIIEGTHDFAVCDSAGSAIIQRKLLVRSADALFSHRKAATDPWDAERWDAVAENSSTTTWEPVASKKFQRFEDGRRRDEHSAATDQRDAEAKEDNNSSGAGSGGNRIDSRRSKPSIESALLIRDIAADLPPVIVTMHTDLLLRFFRSDLHLWVVPETMTVSCRVTFTAMDWCGSIADCDPALRGVLFVGQRSGDVCRVDLVAILRCIAGAYCGTSDVLTTGAAAAATVRARIETFLLQKQTVHSDVVTALSLGLGGTLLSASLDGNIVLSRAATLTPVRTFRADPIAGVRYAFMTPLRNTIVTLTTSNRLSLWGNTNQSSTIDLYDPLEPHYFPIVAVRVDENRDQLLAMDSSGFVKVWSIRRCLPSASFYAVVDQCFSTFRQMYSNEKSDAAHVHNGFRLFDVDEKEGRRPRFSTAATAAGDSRSSGANGGIPSLLQTTVASIEMSNKALQLHPAKHLAYDWAEKRFFVSGVRNNVLCVFTSGSKASTAHDDPVCHMVVCERNRWLISVSQSDCRVWRFRTGVMTLGIKANSPEYIIARVSSDFPPSSARGWKSESVGGIDPDAAHLTLDTCKQPMSTLPEVIRSVDMDTLRRRIRKRECFTGIVNGSKFSGSSAKRNEKNNNNSSTTGINRAVRQMNSSAGSLATDGQNSMVNIYDEDASPEDSTDGAGIVDDTVDAQGAQFKILCAHVDRHERFIFYALRSGDIRMHRTDSGRLVKTFLLLPPTKDTILTAAFQSRHLFTRFKRPNGDLNDSTYSEDDSGEFVSAQPGSIMSLSGDSTRVQAVAMMLQQLLCSNDGTSVRAGTERFFIHREAVGMMTSHFANELGVAYADGIIRYFSLVGNAVHANRIVIPEFLVARAVACLQIARQVHSPRVLSAPYKPQHQEQQHNAGKHLHGQSTPFVSHTPSAEVDAVSFITVSYVLNLLCLVQVNGRVSIIDMSNQGGAILQTFIVSGELTAVTFLGAYPCLVVANAQGCVSFFLIKGSSLLALMEDFFKSVYLHHQKQRKTLSAPLPNQQVPDDNEFGDVNACAGLLLGDMGESLGDGAEQKSAVSGSARRCMWWFRTAGTPSTLHFDTMHCTLYIGTRQGFVSSYLVRNLVIAFDLQPSMCAAMTDSVGHATSTCISSLEQQRKDANECRVSNILLVLFNITSDRVIQHMKSMNFGSVRRLNSQRFPMDRQLGDSVRGFVPWGSARDPKNRQEEQLRESYANLSFSTSPMRLWRRSLACVYDWCRPLFYPPESCGRARETAHLLDLRTTTLADLLLSSAILHHVLLLMSRQRAGKSQSNAEEGLTAASLSTDDLCHLRQCIAEEVRYCNEQRARDLSMHNSVSPNAKALSASSVSTENKKESNSSGSETLPLEPHNIQRVAEWEFDTNELDGDQGECLIHITGDWVEPLFRRHVLQSFSNSPLALLTPNGAIERARRERYERAKLLLLQKNLDHRNNTVPPSTQARGVGSGASTVTAVSVNCDAFFEGISPDVVADVLRHRAPKIQREGEAFNRLLESNEVRSISTRRNGLVFIGCGNGSVSMWSPFVTARLVQISPSVLLEESIRRIGESVKAHFLKKVQRFAQEQQRRVHSSRGGDMAYHEKLMRNLYVSYKVAMMRSEAARVQEQKQTKPQEALTSPRDALSSAGSVGKKINSQDLKRASRPFSSGHEASPLRSVSLFGGSNGILGSGTAAYLSSRNSLPPEAMSDRAVRRRLIEGQRDVLFAVLGIEPASVAKKGLLVEDMYFLPMSMSMLAELEDFNASAYESAVDLAITRLMREIRSGSPGDADAGASADGLCANEDRVLPDDDRVDEDSRSAALAATNALGTSLHNTRSFPHTKKRANGDEDNAIDDAVRFYLRAHECHAVSFFTDHQYRRFACAALIPSTTGAENSTTTLVRHHSHMDRPSLVVAPKPTSPLSPTSPAVPPAPSSSEFVAWAPAESHALPLYARAGVEPGAGFFSLSTALRRDRRLLGCDALDIPRLTSAARWSGAEETARPHGGAALDGGPLAAQWAWLQEPLLRAPFGTEVRPTEEEELGYLYQSGASYTNNNSTNNNSTSNNANSSTTVGPEAGKKRVACFVTQPLAPLTPLRRGTTIGLAAAMSAGDVSDLPTSEETMADPPIQWTLTSKKHTHRARLTGTGHIEQPGAFLPQIHGEPATARGFDRAQKLMTQKGPAVTDEACPITLPSSRAVGQRG